jgi:SAM-dependent methyltransferase
LELLFGKTHNANQTASIKRLSGPPTPQMNENDLEPLIEILRLPQNTEKFHTLFGVAGTISRKEAQEMFGGPLLHRLIQGRLLGEENNAIFSYFHGQWFKGLFFLSDYSIEKGMPIDLVLPVGPSGKYLEAITIRRPVDSALDVGCGCGLQTLFLAHHARLVTATDINPRCLALTRLNAKLNNIHNIELLEGSYFEPVHGRTFDLIVANTPYVITPQSTYTYRDTNDPGDRNVLNMIQTLPSYLNDGGFAQMLATWLHKKNQLYNEPIADIAHTLPSDMLLQYEGSDTPSQYTADWIYEDLRKNLLLFLWSQLTWRWWYWRMGMERFAFGSITMRRNASASHWFHSMQVKKIAGKSAGSHIAALFCARDFLLKKPGVDDLMNSRLVTSNLAIKKDKKGEVQRISLENGFVFSSSIQPMMGQIIKHLNGVNTLREAVQNAALDGYDAPLTTDEILSSIKNLLSIGYLHPTQ